MGRINQDPPALVVYLGDGVDQGGPLENLEAFRGYLDKLNAPWYPVIGNYELNRGARPDGQGGNGEANFRQVFADKLLLNGASYYSFDYQNSHFIVLDTAWQTGHGPREAELKPGSRQWEWLQQDLAGARAKSSHIFVFGHKPPVSFFQAGGPDTESNLTDGHGSSWGDLGAATEFTVPFIEGGRTFVPVRYMAYALGVVEKDVTWDAKMQTVTVNANAVKFCR